MAEAGWFPCYISVREAENKAGYWPEWSKGGGGRWKKSDAPTPNAGGAFWTMREKAQKQDAAQQESPATLEGIRALMAQKTQEGKSKEIKELLQKYGAAKLSAVKPEDYPALMQEAQVL